MIRVKKTLEQLGIFLAHPLVLVIFWMVALSLIAGMLFGLRLHSIKLEREAIDREVASCRAIINSQGTTVALGELLAQVVADKLPSEPERVQGRHDELADAIRDRLGGNLIMVTPELCANLMTTEEYQSAVQGSANQILRHDAIESGP